MGDGPRSSKFVRGTLGLAARSGARKGADYSAMDGARHSDGLYINESQSSIKVREDRMARKSFVVWRKTVVGRLDTYGHCPQAGHN